MTEPTETAPSYHDVYVTTAKMKRTRIFDLPYGYELTCNRVGGWTLWGPKESAPPKPPGSLGWNEPPQIASEYGAGLRIDVAGHVICDSLTRSEVDA